MLEEFNDDGTLSRVSEYAYPYDATPSVTMHTYTGRRRMSSATIGGRRLEYTYDSEGQLVEIRSASGGIYGSDVKWAVPDLVMHEYDGTRCVQRVFCEGDTRVGVETREYEGTRCERKLVDAEGKLREHEIVEPSEVASLEELTRYSPLGKEWRSVGSSNLLRTTVVTRGTKLSEHQRCLYEFDGKGNVRGLFRDLYYRDAMWYDESSRTLCLGEYRGEGGVDKIKCVFEFDRYGNWTARKEQFVGARGDKLSKNTMRTISYR